MTIERFANNAFGAQDNLIIKFILSISDTLQLESSAIIVALRFSEHSGTFSGANPEHPTVSSYSLPPGSTARSLSSFVNMNHLADNPKRLGSLPLTLSFFRF